MVSGKLPSGLCGLPRFCSEILTVSRREAAHRMFLVVTVTVGMMLATTCVALPMGMAVKFVERVAEMVPEPSAAAFIFRLVKRHVWEAP